MCIYVYVYHIYISLSLYIYTYVGGWRNTVGDLIESFGTPTTHRGPQFTGMIVKHRGVWFHRIRDFKQYYFNSILPTSQDRVWYQCLRSNAKQNILRLLASALHSSCRNRSPAPDLVLWKLACPLVFFSGGCWTTWIMGSVLVPLGICVYLYAYIAILSQPSLSQPSRFLIWMFTGYGFRQGGQLS